MDSVEINLQYPFRPSTLHAALSWCDDFHWTHNRAREVADDWSAASMDDRGEWEVLGDPEVDTNEVDVIDRLADLLDTTVGELRTTLEGKWERFCSDETTMDVQGNLIFFWFTDQATYGRALGIGGDALYLEPVTWTADDEVEVAVLGEHPVPLLTGAFYDGVYPATPGHPDMAPLDTLARALGTEEALSVYRASVLSNLPTTRKGPVAVPASRDHEVRMSTRNLLLAGIDIDFDVKVGGSVLGTMAVSEGGLLWRPAGRQRRNGVEITWTQFAHWAATQR